MSDHALLFSAPMVLAMIDGSKTMTRRVAKFVTPGAQGMWNAHGNGGGAASMDDAQVRELAHYYAPYQPGDRIWVRETWRTLQKWDDLKPRHVMDDIDKIDFAAHGYPRNPLWAWGKQRPSIFMPRWASRLTLGVTLTRVERLQDISDTDAIAEGIAPEGEYWRDYQFPCTQICTSPRDSFRTLWDSLNAKRDGGKHSWESNPWVAAYTFTVALQNIDA